MIGLFLAVLELIRQKKIAVDQPEPLGAVSIHLRDDAADEVLFGDPPAAAIPAPPRSADRRPPPPVPGPAEA